MDENAQTCYEIQIRISRLNELSGTDLKKEMDDLKRVLLLNPAACTLLLPEDIGEMVRALKTLIFAAKEASVKPSSSRAKKAPVDLTALLDLEDD